MTEIEYQEFVRHAKLNIAKQDAETGNEAQGDATLEGAVCWSCQMTGKWMQKC